MLLTSLAERAGPDGTSKVDIYALKVFAWNVTDDSLRQPVVPSPSRCPLLLMRARTPHTRTRVVKHKHCAQHSCSTLCSRRRSARNGEGGEERESGREGDGEEDCAADLHPQRKACACMHARRRACVRLRARVLAQGARCARVCGSAAPRAPCGQHLPSNMSLIPPFPYAPPPAFSCG